MSYDVILVTLISSFLFFFQLFLLFDMASSRRVFGPKDPQIFPSFFSPTHRLLDEADDAQEKNDLGTHLGTLRGIVWQQRQEILLFSEELSQDKLFNIHREALVQWMTEV